ncbi:MAG: HGGxSTG domain-containing protein, partial [Deltaproteobacteria bacterium]
MPKPWLLERSPGGRGGIVKDSVRPQIPKNFQSVPRCGARTRKGKPCPNPCVRGRPRCRFHGCAPGAGGQPGNKNRWVHGRRSEAAVAER